MHQAAGHGDGSLESVPADLEMGLGTSSADFQGQTSRNDHGCIASSHHRHTKQDSSRAFLEPVELAYPSGGIPSSSVSEYIAQMAHHEADGKTLPQVDGPSNQLEPERPSSTTARLTTRPQNSATVNAAVELLLYCTTKTPLNKEQVVAMSDIAGSLREVVSLALGAAVDEHVRESIIGAVGAEVAAGIIDFFSDEWVADT